MTGTHFPSFDGRRRGLLVSTAEGVNVASTAGVIYLLTDKYEADVAICRPEQAIAPRFPALLVDDDDPCALQRVCVAQPMGVDALLDPGLRSQPGQQVADVVLAYRPTPKSADQRTRVGHAKSATGLDPPSDDRDRARIKPNHATLVTLAVLNNQRPRFQVDILGRQRQHLSLSKTRPPSQDQQCSISHPRGCPARAGSDQPFDLVRRKHIRVETSRTSNNCQIDLLVTL
jgi:hypothetical protein